MVWIDPRTLFAAVTFLILANGAVLSVIYGDLSGRLRAAVRDWQIGTVMLAIGCASYITSGYMPRTLMLMSANGFMMFGLTFYLCALQRFYNRPCLRSQFLPAVLGVLAIFCFSELYPHFGMRMLLAWFVKFSIIVLCLLVLVRNGQKDSSNSRKMLLVLLFMAATYGTLRCFYYVTTYFSEQIAIETHADFLNLLTPFVLSLLPVTGTTAFVLMCTDDLRRQLERAATTDYLTSLPNRRALVESGNAAFREARGDGGGLGVAILDVDHFKVINDSYGHDVGDKALTHLAQLFSGEARRRDMIARCGGEEFVVLLRGVNRQGAMSFIERLRKAVESEPYQDGANILSLTISAGLSMYRPEDADFDDILRRADNGLYLAKARGRNRVEMMV
ncbi:GGDEF domain-containing protein [Xanthobacter sp. TB0139]|uniref:GGDEF domain-containing protein n=1 Tax=Xanthobacter sp. TB0139 TaxID=3459178 RepID=UPI0040396A51